MFKRIVERIVAFVLAFVMLAPSVAYCIDVKGTGTKEDPWHGIDYINLRFYVDGDTLYMKTDDPENLTQMDWPKGGKALPWDGLDVTNLDISLGAWVVGTESFADGVLPNLESVTIHDGVMYIEARAFANNPDLESITLPDVMTSIKEYAFADTGITEITMPGDFGPGIVEGLFSGCDNLTAVTTPWDCDRIEQNAFYGCDSLETIYYNGTISEWAGIRIASGNNPVYQANIVCHDGEVPRRVYNLGNATAYLRNGMLYIKGSGALSNDKPWNGERITSIIVEEGITSIADSLFSNISSLERVTLPSTLESIGNDAFSGCSELSSLDFNGASFEIGSGAFRDCSSLTSIDLPDGLTKINAECFKGCTYLRSISIPATVTEVGNGAFEGCSKLSVNFGGTSGQWADIVFGEGNEALGGNAIFDESHPVDVGYKEEGNNFVINASIGADKTLTLSGKGETRDFDVKSAPWTSYASSITKVVIENGITYIGKDAFKGFSSLKEVELPYTIDYIKANAFAGCNNLDSVIFRGPSTDWDEIIIESGNEILSKKVTFESFGTKDRPVSIGDEGYDINAYLDGGVLYIEGKGRTLDFEDIDAPWTAESAAITKAVVSEGITYLGSFAFWDCANLEEVSLPLSLKEIGYGAFSDCPSLTTIHYGGSQGTFKLIIIGDENEAMPEPVCAMTEVDPEALANARAYITPYDLGDTYPNGMPAVEDGELHYYYNSLGDAINDLKDHPFSNKNEVIVRKNRMIYLNENLPLDRLTLLYNWDGAYTINKGCIFDMNGHKGVELNISGLDANHTFVMTSGKSGARLNLLYEENASGATVVLNNIKTVDTIKVPNYNTYLLNGNYDLSKISADNGIGSIYWANASELLPARDSKTIEISKIQEMSAYIVPYNKNAEYPGAFAVEEGGETHYYYADINDALNAAKEYPLTFDQAIVNGKLADNIPADRVVFTKDKGDTIGELGWIGETGIQGIGIYGGFRKGIIIDLNGHDSAMLCPGLIPKDKVLIITSSSKMGSVGSNGGALDDEGGTGLCSGNIIFNNVKLNGTVWVASHNIKLLNCDTTNCNYDGVTPTGKVYSNASGSLKLVAGAELEDATKDMVCYITPYKTGVGISYSSLKHYYPCMLDGEIRYYYSDIGMALYCAKSYPLKLNDVLDGSKLKDNIPADRVTLIKDVGSLGDSYDGIAKSVVVDLNGHSACNVVSNQIDDGILVITSSSKMSELTGTGYVIDDYFKNTEDSGIIVLNNIKSSGRVSVANHEIYLVNGDYIDMRFDDIKSKGKVYSDETGKLDSISNNPQRALDDKCAYITPYKEDASYPSGARYEKDGKVYYYYDSIDVALREAIEYPINIEDIIDGGRLSDNIPADKVTFLCSYNSTIGTCGVNGNDGRGGYLAPLVPRLGNSYGFRKGIVIDLNGFNAIGVCPGPINSNSALIITSSAGRSTLTSTGDVFDDESGTGYCSGTVIFNNLKTTGKYWVANHALYLLDGDYNHNFDGLMPDGGVVYSNADGELKQILPEPAYTASILGGQNVIIVAAGIVIAVAAVLIGIKKKKEEKQDEQI